MTEKEVKMLSDFGALIPTIHHGLLDYSITGLFSLSILGFGTQEPDCVRVLCHLHPNEVIRGTKYYVQTNTELNCPMELEFLVDDTKIILVPTRDDSQICFGISFFGHEVYPIKKSLNHMFGYSRVKDMEYIKGVLDFMQKGINSPKTDVPEEFRLPQLP